MVRVLLTVLVFIFICINVCFANDTHALADAIQSYKNQNYEECVTKMKTIVKNDPTNALGHYYLGLSYAKLGKKSLAIQNYNKVISLGSDKILMNLAEQGKACAGGKTITAVDAQLEEIKETSNIELNVKVEEAQQAKQLNEKQDTPKTTKVIKASDYANNNTQPTNDEIVNAIKVLQKAGLLGTLGVNGVNNNGNNNQYNGYNQAGMPQMDAKTQQMNAMLMMMQNGNNNNGMMNMMPFMNGSNGKINPEMIQMMMMNQMMPNFSTGNGNGNGY